MTYATHLIALEYLLFADDTSIFLEVIFFLSGSNITELYRER